jgi:hypothetical protein
MDKQKYETIQDCKCVTCLGCNLLEDINFRGYYRCENYIKGVQNDNKNTTYVQKQEKFAENFSK